MAANPNLNKDGTVYIPHYANPMIAADKHIERLKREGRLPCKNT